MPATFASYFQVWKTQLWQFSLVFLVSPWCQEAIVRTWHGTTDWFQIRKGVHQGCILSPCLFNFCAEYIIRNTGWRKHKLESRLLGEISITSGRQMTPPYGRKWRRAKEPLDESEKGGLKLNIQKTTIMGSGSITSWEIDGKTVETVADFIFLASTWY